MNNFLDQSWAIRFMVVVIGCVAIVAGMHAIASILNPIFIAVLFAVLFDMPRSWLIRRGMSAGMALGLTILGALLITVLFLFLIGNSMLNLSASLPAYQEQLQSQLEASREMLAQAGVQVDQLKTLAQSEATNPLGVIGYVLGGVASILSSAVLILVYAIFLLIEVSGFPLKLNDAFKPSEPAHRYISTVSANLRSFLVAQTQVSLITGVGVIIALWLLGVEFALLWGFVAFLMNFIPYIGSILAAIPAVIVAFIQFGPSTTVLLVIGVYLLVNIVVNYAIYPRLMSQGVDLSMFIVLASMIFWGWVLGPIGLILAVPITAVIKISLESYPGSRWLGVMLGSGPKDQSQPEETSAG
jgi:predicted PurR-regulated permease PerM